MAFYDLIELKKAKCQLLCDKPSRVRMRHGGPLIALGDHLRRTQDVRGDYW